MKLILFVDRVITELSEEAGSRVHSRINDTGVASLCRRKLEL